MDTQNIDHHLKPREPHHNYPLERYMKNNTNRQMTLDLSKLDQDSLIEEDIAKLEVIKNIVRSAEIEINNIATSLTQNKEAKTMHLPEPAYFDKDFDQKRYIQDLVSAKIQGMKIVQEDSPVSKIQKMMILKQALETVNEDRSGNVESMRSAKFSHVTDGAKSSNKESQHKNTSRKVRNDHYVENDEQRFIQDRNDKFTEISSQGKERVTPDDEFLKAHAKNHKLVEIKSQEADRIPEAVNVPLFTKPKLTIQAMPSLNIRSQLIEQKIPSLDIYPSDETNIQPGKATNVALVQSQHSDKKSPGKKVKIEFAPNTSHIKVSQEVNNAESTKSMSPTKNNEDRNIEEILNKLICQKNQITNIEENFEGGTLMLDRPVPQYDNPYIFLNQSRNDPQFDSAPLISRNRKISKLKKYAIPEIQRIYNPKANVRRTVYKKGRNIAQYSGALSSSKKSETFQSKLYDVPILNSGKRVSITQNTPSSSVEYIPYSKLTVGGYSLNEIENYMPKSSTKRGQLMNKISEPVNLDQQKIDDKFDVHEDEGKNVDSDVSDKSLMKNENKAKSHTSMESSNIKSTSTDDKSSNEYDDDFDEDSGSNDYQKNKDDKMKTVEKTDKQSLDKTFPAGFKQPVLKLKKSVDVYDFIHSIETKDDFTQSSHTKTMNFKETQTSPIDLDTEHNTTEVETNEKFNIANLTLKDMLQIQKSLAMLNTNFLPNPINIMDDSSDLPVYKTNYEVKEGGTDGKNFLKIHVKDSLSISDLSVPKNTQTSPLKTQNIMTSPTEMINRILSPIFKDTKTDVGTSPYNVSLAEGNSEDNLPKYGQPNVEIATNEDAKSRNYPNSHRSARDSAVHRANSFNHTLKDSTGTYTDVSHSESSDTQSLGEINLRIFRKKSFIIRRQAKSDTNSNSLVTSSSSDIQIDTTTYTKKSDGEMSIGQILIEK